MPTERSIAGRKAPAISKLMVSQAQLKVSLLEGLYLDNILSFVPKGIVKYDPTVLLVLHTEVKQNYI